MYVQDSMHVHGEPEGNIDSRGHGIPTNLFHLGTQFCFL